MKTLRYLTCIVAAGLGSCLTVEAAPYASGFTNVGSGRIAYWLNSTPAASAVTITTYPSGTVVANTPPTPAQGSNSFVLPGTDTSYTVSVSQVGSGLLSTETIANANTNQTIWGGSPDPRGLDVNTYPNNGPTFGTVYMANGAAGGGKGLGILTTHSDFSYALGCTTAGLGQSVFTNEAAGDAPYKLTVSHADGTVLVSSYDPTYGTVWDFDPYISTATMLLPQGANTSGTSASPYHGQIYGQPRCTGSLAQGNFVLYTFDYTMPTPSAVNSTFGGLAGAIGINSTYFNSAYEGTYVTAPGEWMNLNRYTIGGTANLPVSQLPDLTLNYGALGLTAFSALPGDIEVNPVNGYLYTTSERAAAGSAPWITVYDPSGRTNLYCSAASATVDAVESAITATGIAAADDAGCLIRISADGKYIALGGYYDWVAVMQLTNGIPNVASCRAYLFGSGYTSSARGVGFDAADNIYYMNSGSGDISVVDQGYTQTCVSSNDITTTNGSFSLMPAPAVSVYASTPQAYQANNSYTGSSSPVPAVFTVTLTPAQSLAINVPFTLTGTATNGVNYNASTNGVNFTVGTNYLLSFPAGATNETVTITPTASPAAGPTLTVNMNVSSAGAYQAVQPTNATAYIASSGAEELYVSGTGATTMYRGLTNDFVTFVVTRWGDTNNGGNTITLSSANVTLGGTATFGADYQAGAQSVNWFAAPTPGAGSSITIGPGAVTGTFEVGMPIMHGSYTGNETITATLTSGSGFTAIAGTGTATLLDNLNPPENVVWSDLLTDPTETNAWNVVFSQNATNLTGPGQVNATTEEYIFLFSPLNGQPYNGEPSQNFDANFGYNACSPNLAPDSGPEADFAPYGDGVDVPPSGATNALRLTANKLSSGLSAGPAGVNVYPNTAHKLQGNYAVRFSMNLVRGCGEATGTEYACFGINHYGTNVNYWQDNAAAGSGAGIYTLTNSDGIWFAVTSDAGGFSTIGGFPADYGIFTGTNSGGAAKYFPSSGFLTLNGAAYTSFTNVFKAGVDYNAYGYNLGAYDWGYPLNGTPANQSGWGSDPYSSGYCPLSGSLPTNGPWTDVEIRQSNNVITMSMNKTVIFTYNNVTPFTNGYPMLGYFDPYTGQGSGGGVYYSDIRALELSPDFVAQPAAATVGAGTNHTFTATLLGQGPYTNSLYTSPGNVLVSQVVNNSTTNSDSVSLTVTNPMATGNYYIIVSDLSGSVTSSTVTLTVGQPALVTGITPSSLTTQVGGTASFKATVTGTATVGEQWQSNMNTLANGGIVSGVTTTNLVLTNVVVADSTTYRIKVTNAYATNYGTVVLTVLPPGPSYVTNVSANGTSMVLGFYSGDPYDTTNSFYVQGTTNLTGGISPATNAIVSSNDWGFTNITGSTLHFTVSGTNFNVTVPTNGLVPYQFYRILHK